MKTLLSILFLFILSFPVSADWNIIYVDAPIPGNASKMSSAQGNLYLSTDQYGGIYKSTNNGLNWFAIADTLSNLESFTILNEAIYASINVLPFKVYKSTNEGLSWAALSTLLPSYISSFEQGNNNLYAGFPFADGFRRSTNGGVSWTTLIDSISTNASAINDNQILVMSEYWLHYSSNEGSTFSRLVNFPPFQYANDFIIKDNIFIVSALSSIFRSTNRGQSWTEVSKIGTYCLHSVGNYMFAGTHRKGVYQSTTNGETWESISSYPIDTMSIVTLSSTPTHLIGLTERHQNNGRIIQRPLSEIIGITPISSSVPEGYEISQNFPNPFNPSTKIRFSIPRATTVQLTVYDVSGKLIEQLVNSAVPAGEYEVSVTTNGLTSGIYFYTLRTEEFIETKRMVLVK